MWFGPGATVMTGKFFFINAILKALFLYRTMIIRIIIPQRSMPEVMWSGVRRSRDQTMKYFKVRVE